MEQKSTRIVPTITPPALPRKFPGRALPTPLLETYGRYSQISLIQERFDEQVAERLSFEQMLLRQVSLHGTELVHLQVRDTRLSECDLANANWSQADLARIEVLGCLLTGFHCIESRIQHALFKDCQASLAQFRFTTFNKSARFEHCDFSDADFQGADLSGVVFDNCDLRRVEMSGARLVGADLRGCELDGLRAGWQELQGAIIDPTQALALVQALGIIVKWPEGKPDASDPHQH